MLERFLRRLESEHGLRTKPTAYSRQVFEVDGESKGLVYVKVRSESPYRWGVTANVVERLRAQGLPWCVVLLFENEDNGYVISSQDVDYYINSVWPLANDGDYKPAPGTYLERTSPLSNLNDIAHHISECAT